MKSVKRNMAFMAMVLSGLGSFLNVHGKDYWAETPVQKMSGLPLPAAVLPPTNKTDDPALWKNRYKTSKIPEGIIAGFPAAMNNNKPGDKFSWQDKNDLAITEWCDGACKFYDKRTKDSANASTTPKATWTGRYGYYDYDTKKKIEQAVCECQKVERTAYEKAFALMNNQIAEMNAIPQSQRTSDIQQYIDLANKAKDIRSLGNNLKAVDAYYNEVKKLLPYAKITIDLNSLAIEVYNAMKLYGFDNIKNDPELNNLISTSMNNARDAYSKGDADAVVRNYNAILAALKNQSLAATTVATQPVVPTSTSTPAVTTVPTVPVTQTVQPVTQPVVPTSTAPAGTTAVATQPAATTSPVAPAHTPVPAPAPAPAPTPASAPAAAPAQVLPPMPSADLFTKGYSINDFCKTTDESGRLSQFKDVLLYQLVDYLKTNGQLLSALDGKGYDIPNADKNKLMNLLSTQQLVSYLGSLNPIAADQGTPIAKYRNEWATKYNEVNNLGITFDSTKNQSGETATFNDQVFKQAMYKICPLKQ